MSRARLPLSIVVAVLAAAALVNAAGAVLLKNTFIARYRNRVTITTDFKIDDAHPHPNPIGSSSDDGDLHMAGRSEAIGLPMVVELSNGRLAAVNPVEDDIHQVEGTGQAVRLSGVWRLWMEHKSIAPMQQGDVVPVPADTNPKHVFEIHPLTEFRGTAVLETFMPIRDDAAPNRRYKASDATTAFKRYESVKLTVARGSPFTSIDGPQTPFNYTEFILEVAGQATQVEDGTFVLARIFDLERNMLVSEPRRMVLVKGSRPAVLVGAAPPGRQFRALGIPRIDLDSLMRAVKPGKTKIVQGAYEMIVLAVIE